VGFFATSGILNRRGFFGGSQFSPSNIAGLSFWLDATTGLFDATSGGSAVTTDGSAVARWEDQSGNGRHITQTTLASRPILKTAIQNSKNIIRFDGTNDILRRSGAFVHDQGAATIFVVVSANTGTNDRLMNEGRTANTTSLYMPIISANATQFNVLYRLDNNTIPLNNVNLGVAFNGTGFKLVCAVDSGTNFAGFINKVTTNNQNYTRGTVTLDTFAIGGWATTIERDFFPGDVAEVVIYNTALGTTDRQSVENYLYAKWGIA
jgi:hypothetical protein